MLDEILNSDSSYPAVETLDRLDKDAANSAYKKYVEKLYELFPAKMKDLEDKSITK